MLDWQLVNVPFGQGVDTKTDKLQLPPGKLAELSNGRILKSGQITKRLGYRSLSTRAVAYDGSNATLEHYERVVPFQDQLLAFDGASAYSWSDTRQKWGHVAPCTQAEVTQFPIAAHGPAVGDPDCAYLADVEAYVYIEGASTLKLVTIDNVTRATLGNFTVSETAEAPKVIAFGSKFIVSWQDTGDDKIYLLAQDPTGQTLGPRTGLTEAHVYLAHVRYDVCIADSYLFIAQETVDFDLLTRGLQVRKLDSSLTVVATWGPLAASIDIDVDVGCVSCWPITPTHRLGVAIAGDAQLTIGALSTSTGSAHFATPTTAFPATSTVARIAGVETPDAATLAGVYVEVNYPAGEGPGATPAPELWEATAYVSFDDDTPVTNRILFRAALAGKPFNVAPYTGASKQTFIPAFIGVGPYASIEALPGSSPTALNTQMSQALIMSDGRVVSRVGYQSTIRQRTGWVLAETPAIGTLRLLINAETDSAGLITSRVAAYAVSLVSSAPYRSAVLNSELFVAGSVPRVYDGSQLVEAGFLVAPEIGAYRTDGDGDVPAGTYQYTFVYRWTDARGIVHESTPSVPVEVVLTEESAVYFDVTSLQCTEKTNVLVFGYRTKNLATSPDLTFYRFTSDTFVVYNDPTVSLQTITNASASLESTTDVLYTSGGTLENSASPSGGCPVAWKGRIWLVGQDGKSLFFSKLVTEGHPIEWNDTNYVPVDDKFGLVTALGVMDDHLVIFTDSNVLHLVGEGPDNLGVNNDYGLPQLVTTDAGCTAADSIVTTPLGLMFQSGKGIYLLDRSFQAKYLGAPVEDYTDQPIDGAALVPDASEVRFVSYGSDVVISYNYFFDQWATADIGDTRGCGLWYDRFFTWTDTAVSVEASDYDDAGAATTLSLTTGWLAFAGLQGYQRVRDLLVLADPTLTGSPSTIVPHTVTVSLAYDYDENVWSTPVVFDSTTLGTKKTEQWQAWVNQPRCEAIKVKIDITPKAGYETENPCTLSGLTFRVGMKRGHHKLPSGRRGTT